MTSTKPTCGILAGEPEIIGKRCADGGTCHHQCTSECFRRVCCVPLGSSGLNDDWSATLQNMMPGPPPAPDGPNPQLQAYGHGLMGDAAQFKALMTDVVKELVQGIAEVIIPVGLKDLARLTTPSADQPTLAEELEQAKATVKEMGELIDQQAAELTQLRELTMTASGDNIPVNKIALFKVLDALNGEGHLIRELQYTRNVPGFDNPIDVLINQIKKWRSGR